MAPENERTRKTAVSGKIIRETFFYLSSFVHSMLVHDKFFSYIVVIINFLIFCFWWLKHFFT